MIPLVASALLSAAPEVARGITGIVQNQKANQVAKGLDRPKMQIPESIMDYVNIAKGLTSTGLPGKAAIEGDIERSTANALRAGKEYGASTDVAAIYANEQQQKRELGVEDASVNLQNIDAYQNALKSKAMYEQQVFDYNKAQPYAEAVNAVSAQKNAANTNMFEAVKNLSGIGVSMLSPDLKTDGETTGGITASAENKVAAPDNPVALAPGNESFADKQTRLGRTVVQDWGGGDTKATMEEFMKLLISNPEKAKQLATQLGL